MAPNHLTFIAVDTNRLVSYITVNTHTYTQLRPSMLLICKRRHLSLLTYTIAFVAVNTYTTVIFSQLTHNSDCNYCSGTQQCSSPCSSYTNTQLLFLFQLTHTRTHNCDSNRSCHTHTQRQLKLLLTHTHTMTTPIAVYAHTQLRLSSTLTHTHNGNSYCC